MTSASLMHEAGPSKLVLWDNPEEWGGEGSWPKRLQILSIPDPEVVFLLLAHTCPSDLKLVVFLWL